MSESSILYAESYHVLECVAADVRKLHGNALALDAPSERDAIARKARDVARYLTFLAERLDLSDV